MAKKGRKRFLDGIFQEWYGTKAEFEMYKESINKVGIELGFTVKGDCEKTIEFLDVQVSIDPSGHKTDLHIKPTDANRYLNRKSYHSQHTFRATPFSQFRRAVLICSDSIDRVDAFTLSSITGSSSSVRSSSSI